MAAATLTTTPFSLGTTPRVVRLVSGGAGVGLTYASSPPALSAVPLLVLDANNQVADIGPIGVGDPRDVWAWSLAGTAVVEHLGAEA